MRELGSEVRADVARNAVIGKHDQSRHGGLEQLEIELARASSRHWHDCPNWLIQKVSLLAQFIPPGQLQNDISEFNNTDGDARLHACIDNEVVDDRSLQAALDEAKRNIADQALKAEAAATGIEHANDYHNPNHDNQVVHRLARLIKGEIQPPTKQTVRVLFMAAVYHDAGHPGGPAVIRDGLSYEQVAVVQADAEAVRRGMNIYERILLATAILGTTFGDNIKPTNKIELMLKLADIGGYMEPNEEWIKQSLAVPKEAIKACERGIITKAEIPTYMRDWLEQTDFESMRAAWLVSQLQFINSELRPNHDRCMKHILNWSRTVFNELLDEKQRLVNALQNGTDQSQDLNEALREIWKKYRLLP